MRRRWVVKHLDRLQGEVRDDAFVVPCAGAEELRNVDLEYTVVKPGKTVFPHHHDRATCFVFIVDGHGHALLDGKRVRVRMNDFVLVPPGVSHGFEAGDVELTLYALHTPPLSLRSSQPDLHYRSEGVSRCVASRSRTAPSNGSTRA
ncbi:MAG: cupin domain-containing protein [Planctomycetes bacterium]|nr:cupin domain-containing protein [Planctomycetota bacterium]